MHGGPPYAIVSIGSPCYTRFYNLVTMMEIGNTKNPVDLNLFKVDKVQAQQDLTMKNGRPAVPDDQRRANQVGNTNDSPNRVVSKKEEERVKKTDVKKVLDFQSEVKARTEAEQEPLSGKSFDKLRTLARDVWSQLGRFSDLQVQLDKDSGSIVFKVIDPETHEVIKQIPSEDMLRISKRLTALIEDYSSSDGRAVTIFKDSKSESEIS